MNINMNRVFETVIAIVLVLSAGATLNYVFHEGRVARCLNNMQDYSEFTGIGEEYYKYVKQAELAACENAAEAGDWY